MDHNTDGHLNADERDEFASLAELSEVISLVRADAFHLLGRMPP